MSVYKPIAHCFQTDKNKGISLLEITVTYTNNPVIAIAPDNLKISSIRSIELQLHSQRGVDTLKLREYLRLLMLLYQYEKPCHYF